MVARGSIAILLAAIVAFGAWPAASAPETAGRATAGIEVLRNGPEGASVAGWLAWPRGERAPQLLAIVDGATVRVRLGEQRADVMAAMPERRARAFSARLPAAATSLCLAVGQGRQLTGLQCEVYAGGAMVTAPGRSAVVGSGGRVITYRVRTEGATGLDPVEVAAEMDAIFADQRSWIGPGTLRLQRIDTPDAEVTITVATPGTTDAACAPLATGGLYSCELGNRVNINSDRWKYAVGHWTAPLAEYRAYVTNHEFGHYLGYGHVGCPADGQLAPVMMQQSKFLLGCLPNGWPYP